VQAASNEIVACETGFERLGGINFTTGDPWSILDLLDLVTPRKEVGGGCLCHPAVSGGGISASVMMGFVG
jgi:hypothetical protein